jgi:hypothetical protein
MTADEAAPILLPVSSIKNMKFHDFLYRLFERAERMERDKRHSETNLLDHGLSLKGGWIG